jgi:hypothetical protein
LRRTSDKKERAGNPKANSFTSSSTTTRNDGNDARTKQKNDGKPSSAASATTTNVNGIFGYNAKVYGEIRRFCSPTMYCVRRLFINVIH